MGDLGTGFMPDSIQTGPTAGYLGVIKQGNQQIEKLGRQLATGSRVESPGDGALLFEQVKGMELDYRMQMAALETLQLQTSWYQVAVEGLQSIRSNLTRMSEISMEAISSKNPSESQAWDAEFQEMKAQISAIIDGHSGQGVPNGAFRGNALFMGFAPKVEGDLSSGEVSLYTAYGVNGFSTIEVTDGTETAKILEKGTASGGTGSTVILGAGSAAFDDAYVGMQIEITGGTGAGQSALITDYDAATRTATLDSVFASVVDTSSEYEIDSGKVNGYVSTSAAVGDQVFAEEIWGADNSRIDQIFAKTRTFEALTKEERAYRQANSVPDTELKAQTWEEGQARRKLNIFDHEFGHVLDSESSKRMFDQVNNAIGQISIVMSHFSTKLEDIGLDYHRINRHSGELEQGMSNLGSVDVPEASLELGDLVDDTQKVLMIAGRLTENMRKLNELVRGGGKR